MVRNRIKTIKNLGVVCLVPINSILYVRVRIIGLPIKNRLWIEMYLHDTK